MAKDKAFESKLQNAFKDAISGKISLLPPIEAADGSIMSYPEVARRYLNTENPRHDNWFVSVVASWTKDVSLAGATKLIKEIAPNGSNNWLERISKGEYTDLPPEERRDEIMLLIVANTFSTSTDFKRTADLNPDNIPVSRRGRFAEPAAMQALLG